MDGNEIDIESLMDGTIGHPTSQRLVQKTAELLESRSPWDLNAQEVLDYSYTSKGSLYHHFRDFDELLLSALIYTTGRAFSEAMKMSRVALESTENPVLAREKLKEIVTGILENEEPRVREQRLYLVSLGNKSDFNKNILGRYQAWRTRQWVSLHEICKERGWADNGLNSIDVALALQAAMIGRAVLDNSGSSETDFGSSSAVWNLIDRNFFSPSSLPEN